MERKGASYKVTQKHPAQDPGEHEQVTQGSQGSNVSGWRHPKTGQMMTPEEEWDEESRWEANADWEREQYRVREGALMERKGASYRISSKRPAQTHAEHTQRTNATVASEMYTPRSSYSYGPMDIRAREYDDAHAGRMSVEQMRRVDINPDRL